MKWLQFFRKRKKLTRDDLPDGISEEEEEEQVSQSDSLAQRRRQHTAELHSPKATIGKTARLSLDQWFEARRARVSVDVNSTTTTDKLTVCKAGVTTLINRTYIVIKHLGSGTYGQVKLAFNLRDKKLYAIKSCRKSQYGAAQGAGSGLVSPRITCLGKSRRNSLMGNAQQQQAGTSQAPSNSQTSQPFSRSTANGQQAGMLPVFQGLANNSQDGSQSSQSRPGQSEGGFFASRGTSQTSTAAAQAQAARQQLLGGNSGSFAKPSNPFSSAQPVNSSSSQQEQQSNGGTNGTDGSANAGVFRRPPTWSASQTRPTWASASSLPAPSSSTSASSGQVGAQRLGFASTPAYRYSSAAVGLGSGPVSNGSQWNEGGNASAGSAHALGQGFGWRGRANADAPSNSKDSSQQGSDVGKLGRSRRFSQDGVSSMRRRADEWVREIAIMKKLAHPNIVRLVEVIDDPGSDNLLLVMEYVEGMSLHPRKIDSTHWESVPEHEAWRRARDVLQGLDYLHFHGVVHGDLKPANLMLDSNSKRIKIVDFGSAVITHPCTGPAGVGSFAGMLGGGAMSCTPAFRSPESLKSGYKPSYELDMWALGVTIHMWVLGQLPFNGAAPFLIYESIRRKDLELPADEDFHISVELRDFLHKVLEKDPKKRLDVVGALNHPWVTGNGTAPLPIIQRIPADAYIDAPEAPGAILTGSPYKQTKQDNDVFMERADSCKVTTSEGSLVGKKRCRYAPVRMLSQEELDQAISRSIGEQAISELMGMVFEEVRLAPKQQIIKVGDPVDTIYLIAQGEVEIYQELPPEQAAAAAMLLGCSNQKSRILATVTGPPSIDMSNSDQSLPTFRGSGSRLERIVSTVQQHQGSPLLMHLQPSSCERLPTLQGGSFCMMETDAPPPPSFYQNLPVQPGAEPPQLLSTSQPLQAQHVAGATACNNPENAWTGDGSVSNGNSHQQPQGAIGPSPHMLSAAAASLAQPIISGLGPKHLFSGPQLRELRRLIRMGGEAPELPLTGPDDDDDDEDPDSFLDGLVKSALDMQGPGSAGQPGSKEAVASGSNGRQKQLSYAQTSSLLGSGVLGLKGTAAAPVVVLAVKGPGDTLGLASLEPGTSTQLGEQPVHQTQSMQAGNETAQATREGPTPTQQRMNAGSSSGAPCSSPAGGWQAGMHTTSLLSNHASGPAFQTTNVLQTNHSSPLGESGMGSSNPQHVNDGVAGLTDEPMALGGAGGSNAEMLLSTSGILRTAIQQPPTARSNSNGASGHAGMGSAQKHMTASSRKPGEDLKSVTSETTATSCPTWRANVRARGEVRAFKADVMHIHQLVKEHPELEAAMKHIATQQETDLLVSEALRQLRLVSANIPATPNKDNGNPFANTSGMAVDSQDAAASKPSGNSNADSNTVGNRQHSFPAPGNHSFLLQQQVVR